MWGSAPAVNGAPGQLLDLAILGRRGREEGIHERLAALLGGARSLCRPATWVDITRTWMVRGESVERRETASGPPAAARSGRKPP